MTRFFSLRLGWLFLAGATTYTANEVAAEITKEFDQTFAAGPDHRLVVDAISADVHVTAAETDEIVLHMVWVADTDNAEKAERMFDRLTFEVEENGRSTELNVDRRKDGWFSRATGKSPSVRMELRVPSDLDLVIDLTSGEIVVRGVDGRHVFDTTSASITAENCRGNINADSTSGAVVLRGCPGDHVVDTTSGSILVDGGEGDVRADTTSGAVRILRFPGSHRVDTVSGSVEVSLAGVLTRDCRFDTVSGAIKLLVPADIDARFKAESVSGAIQIEVPGAEIEHKEAHHLVAVTGEGGHTVLLDTVSGAIRVEPVTADL